MQKVCTMLLVATLVSGFTMPLTEQRLEDNGKGIYRQGYIDLNKNSRRDIYEDPKADIDKRIENLLSQMTLNEKTAQTATLYGFNRVLKDELPTPEWKNQIWKDGIANIDEHLNGYVGGRGIGVPSGLVKDETHVWPASNHAKAINAVQKWFIDETRLGIPVDFSAEGIRGLAHF